MAKHWNIPKELLNEPNHIPDFWISTVDGVNQFLNGHIKKGAVETIGTTAGGRPIRAVFYGEPRKGGGTTTLSGSCFIKNVSAFYGRDYEKKVFCGIAGIHGGEFEGIVGMVNLLSVLENGWDLRGREWPDITEAAGELDRVIVIPVLNVDGRQRVPLRMQPFMGKSDIAHDYFNIGAWKDGGHIGWPACKEFIPLDFSKTQFPGGYPNDAGVNIMHDDFFGARQPETQALLDLTGKEKPDLILNAHTGAPPENYYIRLHKPFMAADMDRAFDGLYRQVHAGLALEGLQGTMDPEAEGDPAFAPRGRYNLDTALNLHCGSLVALYENPSHSYSGANSRGKTVVHTPDRILDGQLVLCREAFRYLAGTGGRCRWAS